MDDLAKIIDKFLVKNKSENLDEYSQLSVQEIIKLELNFYIKRFIFLIIFLIIFSIKIYLDTKNLKIVIEIFSIYMIITFFIILLIPFRINLAKNFNQKQLDYEKKIEEKRKNGEKLGFFNDINEKTIKIIILFLTILLIVLLLIYNF